MHLAWIDLRQLTDPMTIAEEAIHAGAHGLLAEDSQLLDTLPPSVQRVGYVPPGGDDATVDELAINADILIFEHIKFARRGQEAADRDIELGVFVTVDDHESLDTANSWASGPHGRSSTSRTRRRSRLRSCWRPRTRRKAAS